MVETTSGASVNVLCTMAPQRQTVLCPATKIRREWKGEERAENKAGEEKNQKQKEVV